MVAVKTTLKAASAEIDADTCPDCSGTGTIRHSSEISFFEDLLTCRRCEAGRTVELKIAEIVARARAEERFTRQR